MAYAQWTEDIHIIRHVLGAHVPERVVYDMYEETRQMLMHVTPRAILLALAVVLGCRELTYEQLTPTTLIRSAGNKMRAHKCSVWKTCNVRMLACHMLACTHTLQIRQKSWWHCNSRSIC